MKVQFENKMASSKFCSHRNLYRDTPRYFSSVFMETFPSGSGSGEGALSIAGLQHPARPT